MIQANELRIGNLLNYQTAEGDVVTLTTDFHAIQWATEDTKGFNLVHTPIPLTEEWLIKFGFDSFSECGRKTGTFGHLKINGIYFDLNNKKLIFIDKGWRQSVCFEKIIEYAHELQNIIFALRGKELTTLH